ncbi:DNA polymerase I [Candidatus Hartigia pinicola]|nr:DNA polymerase I [Candidatus Hartigia pinicola]
MTKIAENPFILVDGSSYLYRAYHACPLMTNTAGESTGAMYGVINMLRSLLVQYKPSHMAVVFDAKGKTFRDKLFHGYKSHRPPMPNDLQEQVAPLHKIIKAMGLPLLVVSGVEADDVIGTLAQQVSLKNIPVLISTNDKDMAQLVDPHITLINTMNNTILDPKEVEKKYSVPPELIIDFFALMGDSSDNIPGVPGIGQKTALSLLKGIGNLEKIYNSLDNIAALKFRGSKTLALKMKKNRELAFLSYQLATIKTDIHLKKSYKELAVKELNTHKLYQLFSRYEFKRLLTNIESGIWMNSTRNNSTTLLENTVEKNIQSTVITQPTLNTKNYEIILKNIDFERWLEKLASAPMFSFNTEIDSLSRQEARLVGISFSIKPGHAAYLPIGHDYINAPVQLPIDKVMTAIKPILENRQILKIGQNLKNHAKILENYNIKLQGIEFDIMLESYILSNLAVMEHDNISILAKRHLNYKTTSLEDIAGKNKIQLTFNKITLEKAANYAAENTAVTLLLHKILFPKLEAKPKLAKIFRNIEMLLVPILIKMERKGVLIDATLLASQSKEIQKSLMKLEQEAFELAGGKFNLGSPQQLQTILFTKLKLPIIKIMPTGRPSTNENVLEQLALYHTLPKLLLKYRNLSKLKSTYIDKLPLMINSKTQRVHTSYKQAVTVTGRLSSRDPNLQNIPIRTEAGRQIRQAFIARKGYKIMSADYSQIELRIIAHLSQDIGLLHAFSEDKDIHKITAAEIFDLSINDVTNEQRHSAKIINFGLIYGMSAFGLSRQLSIARCEAKRYIDLYFERYPGVLSYMKNTSNQASEKGYVETLEGRRLYIANITSTNRIHYNTAEREAINAPIQGTAADIIKKAMIAIENWLKAEKLETDMLMQVHDELVFEVKESEIDKVTQKVCELMKQTIKLDVPLKVNAYVGNNWDEAH